MDAAGAAGWIDREKQRLGIKSGAVMELQLLSPPSLTSTFISPKAGDIGQSPEPCNQRSPKWASARGRQPDLGVSSSSFLQHVGDRQVPNAPYYMYRPYLRCEDSLWNEIVNRMPEAGVNTVVIDLGDGVQYQSHPRSRCRTPGRSRS